MTTLPSENRRRVGWTSARLSRTLSARRIAGTCLALMLVAALPLAVQGGGPSFVDGQGGIFRWNPDQPVNFLIDRGPLSAAAQGSSEFSNEEGAALVRELFEIWRNVKSSGLTFEDRGAIGEDVDQTNYGSYLTASNSQGNPIVFDADGSITDDLLGPGSSDFVLGFANSLVTDSADNFYDYGFAVLNGKSADNDPNGTFRRTVLHEIGHLLGLDHSQAGLQFFGLAMQPQNIAIMFPIVFPGAAQLHQDELAWISEIYPASDQGMQEYGRVRGVVRRRSGSPFLGANVVAAQVEVLEGVVRSIDAVQVSVVSDYLAQADGRFELPGLPPGDYVLFIEPLRQDFVGGSGVGPYEFRYSDFPRDFYNGSSESGDPQMDDPIQRTVFAVEAGQVVDNLELISNETANALNTLGDDDEELFLFPDGFSFPFFGVVYDSVVVNSDGNLTFGVGDSASSERSEARFLTGPPRIAPLFTDLDPTAGGAIRASLDEGSLSFHWDGVPEFGSFTGGGNFFSVTLFSNGDVRFYYDTLDVTPDPGNIQAIVGVSPGSVALAEPIDLSQTVGGIPFEETVYELFSGNTVDLHQTTLFYQASGDRTFLYSPFYLGDADTFTGFAVTNDTGETSYLRFEAFDDQGERRHYPANPSVVPLGQAAQLAELGSNLFGLGLTSQQEGWVRIGSTQENISGLVQFGNGVSGPTTLLDGALASREQSQVLYFTRLNHGAASLSTGKATFDATTTLFLANPNPEPIALNLLLFDGEGAQVGPVVVRHLNARGSLLAGIGDLFERDQVDGGFVRVDVDGPGAVGFQLIETADTVLGLNSIDGNDGSRAFSGQMATGGSGVTAIFTSLQVINVAPVARQVTLTAIRDNGDFLGSHGPVMLAPNQSLQQDMATLFQIPEGTTVNGSLQIVADGEGVIGNVVFGDPDQFRYGAALPLQSRLLERALFNQVANSRPGRARDTLFTGLAFFNPGATESAVVTVSVFSAAGAQTGRAEFSLNPGTRRADLVSSLAPQTLGQVGGYILVESTVPIVAQQVFGNFSLDFMSAVPPSITR